MALTKHLRFMVGELLRPLKGVTPGVALDVGCGMGIVLGQLRRRGGTPYGVDVPAYATEYARREFGLEAFTGTIDDVALPSDSVDLVAMLLTIEHLPDPKSVLRSVHRLLKSGGVLIVGTHDAEGLWPRLIVARWRHYSMPEHVYYFSRRTLTRMLADVGLEAFLVTEAAKLAGVVGCKRYQRGALRADTPPAQDAAPGPFCAVPAYDARGCAALRLVGRPHDVRAQGLSLSG